jgi:hypothetical protein
MIGYFSGKKVRNLSKNRLFDAMPRQGVNAKHFPNFFPDSDSAC